MRITIRIIIIRIMTIIMNDENKYDDEISLKMIIRIIMIIMIIIIITTIMAWQLEGNVQVPRLGGTAGGRGGTPKTHSRALRGSGGCLFPNQAPALRPRPDADPLLIIIMTPETRGLRPGA